MIKKYRIYVDTERHRDIYERLESIPRPLRGEFIRAAIRSFMDNTEKMIDLKAELSGETFKIAKEKPLSGVFG